VGQANNKLSPKVNVRCCAISLRTASLDPLTLIKCSRTSGTIECSPQLGPRVDYTRIYWDIERQIRDVFRTVGRYNSVRRVMTQSLTQRLLMTSKSLSKVLHCLKEAKLSEMRVSSNYAIRANNKYEASIT
jgi:hypothetical protein